MRQAEEKYGLIAGTSAAAVAVPAGGKPVCSSPLNLCVCLDMIPLYLSFLFRYGVSLVVSRSKSR